MKPNVITDDAISFQSVANELNVSLASVRNWVTSGELSFVKTGYVSQKSLNQFKNEVIGKTRLAKRANKLHADHTNYDALKSTVISSIKSYDRSLVEVSDFYETSLGKSYRNQEGIYYTPDDIVDKMFNRLLGDVSELKFFDPCCGSGNFLLGALRRGFKQENIFGVDCDDTALEIAKARIEEKTGSQFKNLKCEDFLKSAQALSAEQTAIYDVIFTNPPWGKKYQKHEKIAFADLFNNGISLDSSALFTLAVLRFCSPNAKIGMLLPDSFSNIAAFKSLREKLLSFEIESIEDHKRPFKGLMVGAVSIIFTNKRSEKNSSILCISGLNKHERKQKSFEKNPNWILNFNVDQPSADLISYLYTIDHIRLNEEVSWGLGIVTGNNKKFCFSEKQPLTEEVYSGADILSVSKLKLPSKFISPDFSKYQQVASKELYRAEEKLIYKFISNRLCFFFDNKQRLILNSANMLIASKSFPITLEQLAFLLNSELMNFIFRSVFRTHKVLRSNLESLPIFYKYFENHENWTEQTLLDYLNIEERNGTYRIKK